MFVLQALVVLILFMVIDLIWLGFVGRGLYQKYIGHLLKADVNWPAAIIFYLLFVGGLTFFAVNPAVTNGEAFEALYLGGFFGLLMYATYDLTNLATLKDWPVAITLIDLVWGTALGGVVSILSYVIIQGLNL